MSPLPEKMGENGPALAMKCLELCQTLISQGKAFKLTMGSNFSFSLDTREEVVSLDSRNTNITNTIKETVMKKKLSPSAKRRNQKRKEEFLKKKHQTCSEQPEKPEEKGKDKPTKPQMKFNCDLCEFSSSTKHGVSVHMGHTHKVESLRDSSLDMSLETSLPSEEREPDNNSTPVKTKDTDNDCEVDPDAIKAEWIRLIKEIADTDYRDEKRRRELRIKKFDLNDLADEHGILLWYDKPIFLTYVARVLAVK